MGAGGSCLCDPALCSSWGVGSEEVTDRARRRNGSEEGQRSLRSQSPVLGCVLWVTLLEQGLGQGQHGSCPIPVPIPELLLLQVCFLPSPGAASCGSVFGAHSVLLSFSECVVIWFDNTAVHGFCHLGSLWDLF